MRTWLCFLLALPLLSACSEARTPTDGGPLGDASMSDPDAGPPPPPPPPMDAGPPPPRYPGLPVSCWLPPGSACNPANNEGCEPDESCDLSSEADGTIRIVCFPPPSPQALGEACNNETGPFCQGGLRCMDRVCRDTCCDDLDCEVEGEHCIPLDPRVGTLGVCGDEAPMPVCAPPGGGCSRNADCCSNDCHFDHCH